MRCSTRTNQRDQNEANCLLRLGTSSQVKDQRSESPSATISKLAILNVAEPSAELVLLSGQQRCVLTRRHRFAAHIAVETRALNPKSNAIGVLPTFLSDTHVFFWDEDYRTGVHVADERPDNHVRDARSNVQYFVLVQVSLW